MGRERVGLYWTGCQRISTAVDQDGHYLDSAFSALLPDVSLVIHDQSAMTPKAPTHNISPALLARERGTTKHSRHTIMKEGNGPQQRKAYADKTFFISSLPQPSTPQRTAKRALYRILSHPSGTLSRSHAFKLVHLNPS